MSTLTSRNQRVLSGMRPSGRLHLGNYHGALKNWVKLQHEYECFFFVADWHALTTHYDDTSNVENDIWEMVIDWLAAGVNPKNATLFVQSMVPEHAELHLLLSMITPVSWLERVPTYKDQQDKLKERDLSTYGFLGYPLLQAADILIYKAGFVPVGEDQVVHVELTREIARRFNFIFGREPDFEERVSKALRNMGGKAAKPFKAARKKYQETGNEEALAIGLELIQQHGSLTVADRERLIAHIEGGGRPILAEPDALLTEIPKMPGLDGLKMSKSYGNTISMREDPDSLDEKIRKMPTDPARIRLTDPGDPKKCPVWDFHKIYSDSDTQNWVVEGCTKASMGCLDCKKPLIEKMQAEIEPIRERAKVYEDNIDLVKNIIQEGSEKARDAASKTMDDVRQSMKFDF